ncbi:MAG: PhnD/SsuA/transferrin family substrate-binding protein [Anaerolineae bacterium]|nr:PhnD/SsuA/transferrin family substrate-binding protein [Anaerolineae bacterium]
MLALVILLFGCQSDPETVQVTVPVTVPVTVEVTRVMGIAINSPVVEPNVPAASPTPPAKPIPGSPDYPIYLLFPPTVPGPVIEARQQPFLDALREVTGFTFESVMPTTFTALLETLCTEADRTITFLPPEVYVLAHERCGAQVGQAYVRLGVTWNAGMMVVRNETPILTLEDIAGQTWGIPGEQSYPGYLFFAAMFQQMGLTPGEITDYASESRAMAAVYNREVTMAAATYVPPILPYNDRPWQYGVDDPELWRPTFAVPVRSGIGYVIVNGDVNQGGYRLREARAALLDTIPGIFVETRILALTPPIPFDAVVYGPALPFNIAHEVAVAMMAFTSQSVCIESICSADFLNLEGLAPVADSFYDSYREMMATLGRGDEILGE